MPEVSKVILADGTETTRTEPLIPARTSTKLGVVGAATPLPLLEILQSFDWPGMQFDNFLQTQAAAWLATLAVAYFTARIVKSPSAKQAL